MVTLLMSFFFHFQCAHSNAVLPTESHLAKTATKNADAPPPSTPMEKYKLRVSVARQTGRLDLACKAVWEAEDGAPAAGSASAGQKTSSAKAAAPVAPNGDPDGGGGEDGVFLTQDLSRTASNDSEEVGIFQQVASHRGDDPAEEAALAAEGQLEATKAGGKRRPVAMVVDFRLSVIPSEVLRLTGTNELMS